MELRQSEADTSHGAEKESLRLIYEGPYRKPTQVGEMSILRRTRELALRNSAKCTRNFGRSVASGGCQSLLEVAEERPRRLFTKNTGLC